MAEHCRSLFVLGRVAASQGDYAVARALYEESLAIGREVGDNLNIAFYSGGIGRCGGGPGRSSVGSAALGGGRGPARSDGNTLPPVDHVLAMNVRWLLPAPSLARKAFAAAWAEGRMMTPEQALPPGKGDNTHSATSATPVQQPPLLLD